MSDHRPAEPGRFRNLGEETIYQGHVVTMARGRYEAPDGTVFTREIVHHPGAVVVVPMVDDTTALLVRQYRAVIGMEVLEVPAGKRDVAGEPPEVTARRELAEEVGRSAARLDLLGCFYNSAGFCDEYTWAYLGRDLTEVPLDRQGVEEQYMTIEPVRVADVYRLVASGELNDAKTIIALSLAAHRLAGAQA